MALPSVPCSGINRRLTLPVLKGVERQVHRLIKRSVAYSRFKFKLARSKFIDLTELTLSEAETWIPFSNLVFFSSLIFSVVAAARKTQFPARRLGAIKCFTTADRNLKFNTRCYKHTHHEPWMADPFGLSGRGWPGLLLFHFSHVMCVIKVTKSKSYFLHWPQNVGGQPFAAARIPHPPFIFGAHIKHFTRFIQSMLYSLSLGTFLNLVRYDFSAPLAAVWQNYWSAHM